MIPQVPSGEGAPDFDSDSEDELPPGWEERATPQGQVFYVNHVDKSTQWTHPRTGKRKKVAGELPFGWKEQVEPDGTILFIDTVNNKTTYSDPRLAFAVELKDDKNDIRQRFDSFSTAMQVLHGRDLSGNVAIVTGASAGIGVETARSLAHHGCHVIMACRSRNKTQAVIDNIHEFRPNAKLDFLELDLASMKSVKEFAENFKAQFQRLDYLILNAGIFMVPFARTEDGFELTFQVNHLSQMYLTLLLRDILIKTPMARVVAVSSESHRFTRLTTSNISQEYLSPNSSSKHWSMMAYNLSKLHNILFTNALNRRLAPHGVCCNAVHPGNLVYTELSRSSWFMRVLFFAGRPFTKTLQQGAATTIYAAVAPELQGVGGQYFNNCFLTKPHAKALDVDLQEKLWTVSIEMIRSCMGNIDDVPPHPDVK